MYELLVSLGQVAGIGGISLGIFFILFKRVNLPLGTRRHVTLFMWLVWSFCLFGIAAYLIKEYMNKPIASLVKDLEKFEIELACNAQSPGERSSLASLFDYAEEHEGEIIEASITAANCKCPIEREQKYPILDLQPMCDINSEAWSAKLDLNCVHSITLVRDMHAGHASFCFPKPENLPRKKGYKRSFTAVEEYISGQFIINYDFSGGAEHVALVVPES